MISKYMVFIILASTMPIVMSQASYNPINVGIMPVNGTSRANEMINFTTTHEFPAGSEYITEVYLWFAERYPNYLDVNTSLHTIIRNETNQYRYYGIYYNSTKNLECDGNCIGKCCYKNYEWVIGNYSVGSENRIYIYNDILFRDDTKDYGTPDVITDWRIVNVTAVRSKLNITWEVRLRTYFENKSLMVFSKAKSFYNGMVNESDYSYFGNWSVMFIPDPCRQGGTFCPSGATGSPYDTTGFCINASTYYSNVTRYRPLGGDYSCGSNYCCIACVNQDCCWDLRGFCYSYSGGSQTGCSYSSSSPNSRCADEGGDFCTSNAGSNIIIDRPTQSAPRYGPIKCAATPQSTTTTIEQSTTTASPTITTTTMQSTTTTIAQSTTTYRSTTTVGGQSTTTTQQSTTTTPPTTVTPQTTTTRQSTTTVVERLISCENYEINIGEEIVCTAYNCNSGRWILENTENKPLKNSPLTVVIPPFTIRSQPTQEYGTVKVTAICSNPVVKGEHVEISVVGSIVSCPEMCIIQQDCTCTISGCNEGISVVSNYEGNPLDSPIIKEVNGYTQLKFLGKREGKVSVEFLCLDPQSGAIIKYIEITKGDTTTSYVTTTAKTTTTTSGIEIFRFNSIPCDSFRCTIKIAENSMSEDVTVYLQIIDDYTGKIYYYTRVKVDAGRAEDVDVPILPESCNTQTMLKVLALAYSSSDLTDRIDRFKASAFQCEVYFE